jgi:hypothetical protein
MPASLRKEQCSSLSPAFSNDSRILINRGLKYPEEYRSILLFEASQLKTI